MTVKKNPNGLNINISLTPDEILEMLDDMAYYDDVEATADNVEDFISYVFEENAWDDLKERIMEMIAETAQDFNRTELPRIKREESYDL